MRALSSLATVFMVTIIFNKAISLSIHFPSMLYVLRPYIILLLISSCYHLILNNYNYDESVILALRWFDSDGVSTVMMVLLLWWCCGLCFCCVFLLLDWWSHYVVDVTNFFRPSKGEGFVVFMRTSIFSFFRFFFLVYFLTNNMGWWWCFYSLLFCCCASWSNLLRLCWWETIVICVFDWRANEQKSVLFIKFNNVFFFFLFDCLLAVHEAMAAA